MTDPLRAAALAYAPDQPYERGIHELDGPNDWYCDGCGARAPFKFDDTKPEWWTQEPDPNTGHTDDCRWVALRAALAADTARPDWTTLANIIRDFRAALDADTARPAYDASMPTTHSDAHSNPLRAALDGIYGECQEYTVHQHGNPVGVIDAIERRVLAAIALAAEARPGLDVEALVSAMARTPVETRRLWVEGYSNRAAETLAALYDAILAARLTEAER